MAAEEWRTIPGFEQYEVSSLGRARSIDRQRQLPTRWGFTTLRWHRGRILKLRLHTQGYLRINTDGDVDVFVHRAIAEAFHGPPPSPTHEVAHVNGIKTDNRPKNIIWATPIENAFHKRSHGTHPGGVRNGQARLNPAAVCDLLRRYADGESAAAIASSFHVRRATVLAVVGGKNWASVESPDRFSATARAQANIAARWSDAALRARTWSRLGGKWQKKDRQTAVADRLSKS